MTGQLGTGARIGPAVDDRGSRGSPLADGAAAGAESGSGGISVTDLI